MYRFYFIAAALLLALSSATASERGAINVNVNGTDLPATILDEVRGEASLTQNEFASKVGASLVVHANQTRTEACAMLCRTPQGQWGAAPLSVGSHAMCPITGHCPNGMTPVDVSIHSHPLAKGTHYKVNVADAVLGSRVGSVLRAGDPEAVSDEDRHGSGYIITFQGVLLFYGTRGRVQRLGNIVP